MDENKRYESSFTGNLQNNKLIEWGGAMDHGGGVRGEREEIVWDLIWVQSRCHGESIASTGGALWAEWDQLCSISISLSLSLHSLHSLYLLYYMWTDWQEIE